MSGAALVVAVLLICGTWLVVSGFTGGLWLMLAAAFLVAAS